MLNKCTKAFGFVFGLATVFAVSLLVAQSAWAVASCELNGQPINTNNGKQTAGKSGMIRCVNDDTGQTEREYELREGKSFGLSRYFRQGKLYLEFTSTIEGPREGLEREWAANGQLVLELSNVSGRARGMRRAWYDNGQPRRVEFVADTERDGAAVEYTPRQQLGKVRCGPKPLLAPYVDDATLCGFGGRDNTHSTYRNDGSLRGTQTLLAGVVQKATLFDDNGKPQHEEERQGNNRLERYYASNGSKQREKLWSEAQKQSLLTRDAEYHSSGALVSERLYTLVTVAGRQGTLLESESRFYLNGQPRSKHSFSFDSTGGRDQEVRDSQYFSDKGTLIARGHFVLEGRYRERPVGVHQTFFENGKSDQETTYNDKGKPQRQRVWDKSGNLLSDDTLFEDGSRKAYAQ